jgi:Domain of unknown function (DUF4395)
MGSAVIRNFMRQQGFGDEPDALCNMHFSGLYFQPRIVGSLVVVAIVLGSPWLFLALSAVLWWNVLLPKWNPFEAIYNRFLAAPRGWKTLSPAPPARRFAQGMAAVFMLGAALALLGGWMMTAWVLEAFVVVAFSSLLFGKFCLGAYIYHVLRGRWDFANATLPWARPQG